MENLSERIEKIIYKKDATISILVKELNKEDPLYNLNSNLQMISASLIKVPIMLSILEEVKEKKACLDDKILVKMEDILDDTKVFENGEGYYSLYELINWMIITSDNTATNVLIKIFGMEKINHYIFNVLHLKSTSLQRYMLDENAIKNGLNNYSSQEDMLSIFTKLFNKEILNHELCDKAIQILYNQRCQDQIMRYIYEPIKYAHKTGSLEFLNHDSGIMNINNKLFYIGISIYHQKKKENKKLIGKLGKVIYRYIEENII